MFYYSTFGEKKNPPAGGFFFGGDARTRTWNLNFGDSNDRHFTTSPAISRSGDFFIFSFPYAPYVFCTTCRIFSILTSSHLLLSCCLLICEHSNLSSCTPCIEVLRKVFFLPYPVVEIRQKLLFILLPGSSRISLPGVVFKPKMGIEPMTSPPFEQAWRRN